MKHTPGPWKVIEQSVSLAGGVYGPQTFGQDRNWIADTNVGVASQRNANERLIAAAPELLEQLKIALRCIEYCRKAHPDVQSGSGIPVETFIKAAIAKAEGKR